jgi:plasmid replication initiation protein
MSKLQQEVIADLQKNPDFVILNNIFAAPKFIKKVGKQGKERVVNDIYTPKIFFEIISQLTPQHLECVGDYVSIEFNVGEFLKLIDPMNSNNDYNYIINCLDDLQTTTIRFDNQEIRAGFSVLPYYKYEKRTGITKLDIRKELAEVVLVVKQSENFSFLKKYIFRLNNAHAIKLFPYFMSWRNKGRFQITLEAFKSKFGYNTDGYKKFINLKLKVLEPALAEINEKTNYEITYKVSGENLTGARRRVSGLQFSITEKPKQKQVSQKAKASEIEYAEYEVLETKPINRTPRVPHESKPTPSKAVIVQPNIGNSPTLSLKNDYFADILRVFHFFEPDSTPENINGFLSAFADQKAVLEACLYAEQEQLKRNSIRNFRGYLVMGIPKGLGCGILEQRAKDQAKAQQVEQKKTAQVDKAIELENLLKEAEILRGGYRIEIDMLLKNTLTKDKENVAAILRAKSSTYSTRTLAEFTSIMFIAAYLETFIATYPEYFADVQRTYQEKFDGLTVKIKKLDPTKAKNLFHY